MARRPLGPIAWVFALLLAAWNGIFLVGTYLDYGHPLFRNGDAAVYAWQVDSGILGERVTHVGWIALGMVLRPLTGDGALALDILNQLAAVGIVLGLTGWGLLLGRDEPEGAFPSTRLMGRVGVDLVRLVAPILVVCVLLPWAFGAEVDLPWMALLVGAVVAPWRGLSGVLAALAVAVSPTALLALPVALLARRMAGRRGWWAPAVGAVAAVLLLAVGSQGDWLWADRGVLLAPTPRPWRALQAWGVALSTSAGAVGVTAAFVALRGVRHLAGPGLLALACLPMLAAPPDTFGWLPILFVIVALVAMAAPRVEGFSGCAGRGFVVVATLITIGLVPATWWESGREGVWYEDAHVRGVARNLGPEDGLVTTWSRGVRVSLIRTGDPYAYRWRVPDGFVRDQQATWCAEPLPARVWDWTGERREPAWRDAWREDCP